MVNSIITTLYTTMTTNYVAIVTLLVVIVLTFFLPDKTQKLHAAQELKDMKKVLDKMSDDVKQAEAACLTVAEEICCLQCMHDDTTETVSIVSKQNELQDVPVSTSNCMRTTQSEPAQVHSKLGFIRRIFFPNTTNTSHKEITIMSYVYTDSFDAQKPVIPSDQ